MDREMLRRDIEEDSFKDFLRNARWVLDAKVLTDRARSRWQG